MSNHKSQALFDDIWQVFFVQRKCWNSPTKLSICANMYIYFFYGNGNSFLNAYNLHIGSWSQMHTKKQKQTVKSLSPSMQLLGHPNQAKEWCQSWCKASFQVRILEYQVVSNYPLSRCLLQCQSSAELWYEKLACLSWPSKPLFTIG